MMKTVIKWQLNRIEKYFHGQSEMTLGKKNAKKSIVSYRDAKKMIVVEIRGGK